MVTQSESIIIAACEEFLESSATGPGSDLAKLAMAMQIGLLTALHYPEYALALVDGVGEELKELAARYVKHLVLTHPITSDKGS